MSTMTEAGTKRVAAHLDRASTRVSHARIWRALTLVCLVAVVAFGCTSEDSGDGSKSASDSGGRKRVVAVNYALAYFAERIAGDAVEVDFPAPPGVDPAYWRPSDEELASIQSADLILRNGAGYAKWTKAASLPASRVVDTSASFADRYIEVDGPTHSHGPGGEHSHKGTDFNTWVDPTYARAQAQAVLDALLRLVPESQTAMRKNYEALAEDLRALDRAFDELAERMQGIPLIASHPVYNYIADRYEWNLESLHWEPEEMPSEAQFEKLTQLLARHPAKIMIWEAHPDRAIAEKLAADYAMGEAVFFPLGNRPEEGDFLSVMRDNLGRLEAALSE